MPRKRPDSASEQRASSKGQSETKRGGWRPSGTPIIVDGLRPVFTFLVPFFLAAGAIWAAAEEKDHTPFLVFAGIGAFIISVTTKCRLYVRAAKKGNWSATRVQEILLIPVYKTRVDLSGYNELQYREQLDLLGLLLYVGGIVIGMLFLPVFGAAIAFVLFGGILGKVFYFLIAGYDFSGSGAKSKPGKYSAQIGGDNRKPIRLCRLASKKRVNSMFKQFKAKADGQFVTKSLGGSF